MNFLPNLPYPILILLAVWDLSWKGYSLWVAAKSSQRNWFIALLVFNTVGILPIVYLAYFSKDLHALSKALVFLPFKKQRG